MIEAIVNAAVSRIRALQGVGNPLGFAIPRVEPLDGQLNQVQVADLLKQTPAVFVAFQLAKPEPDRAQLKWGTKVNLLVVTQNLATEGAAALGGPGALGQILPGAYLLAELLAIALSDDKLGLQIEGLAPEEIRTLVPGWARDRKAAVVGVQFATAFWTPRNSSVVQNPDQLADFLRVQTKLALGDDRAPYTDLTETRS